MNKLLSLAFLISAAGCATPKVENKSESASQAVAERPIDSENTLKNHPSFEAMAAAISAKDEKKLRAALDPITKKPEARSEVENDVVNAGLYLVTLDGLSCDAKLVHVLEKTYQAHVSRFKALNFISVDKSDANSPLCKDVVANSLARMKDVPAALNSAGEYYVQLINDGAEKNIEKKAAAYNKLLTTASYMIVEACKKSDSDPICLMKTTYKSFANSSKSSKTKSVKRNAGAVLDILK